MGHVDSVMLKVRVIPTLLWKDVGLVKGIGFDSWRRVGTVLPAIKLYNARDVDELVLLDIGATREGREPDYDSLRSFASACFVPLSVGGGVSHLAHVKNLLRSGADKVVINSAAYDSPELIRQIADRFGSQCVTVSIDVRQHLGGEYECYSHSGQTPTGHSPASWAVEMEAMGAGEILLTAVERDGTMAGYDLALIHQVASRVSIPVIASGGAGNAQHCYEALCQGGASAVAAASLFHFTEQTPQDLKLALERQGIPVRLNRA